MSKPLIGNDPNQVPRNADLGELAYTSRKDIGNVIDSDVVQNTGNSDKDVMSQAAVTTALADKQDNSSAFSGDYNDLDNKPTSDIVEGKTAYGWGNHASAGYAVEGTSPDEHRTNSENDSRFIQGGDLVQSTGTSQDDVMSQDAVSTELAKKNTQGTSGSETRTNQDNDSRFVQGQAGSGGAEFQNNDANTAKFVQKSGDTLEGGFIGPDVANKGSQSSGSFRPDPNDGNWIAITNTGSFTFQAPNVSGCYNMSIDITNGSGAGNITFSGFVSDYPKGDDLTTNTGDAFKLHISKTSLGV